MIFQRKILLKREHSWNGASVQVQVIHRRVEKGVPGIGKERRRQVETRIKGLFLRLLFYQKGKKKLPNFSKGEDKAGFKGFAGFPHCGSSVAVFPSYQVTREKGLNSVGSCGMMGVENLEVSSYQHSQSSLSLLPPPSGLALPHLSPSVSVLPNAVIQYQFPTKP